MKFFCHFKVQTKISNEKITVYGNWKSVKFENYDKFLSEIGNNKVGNDSIIMKFIFNFKRAFLLQTTVCDEFRTNILHLKK